MKNIMSTERHGRPIEEVWMPNESDVFHHRYKVGEAGIKSMYFSATCHGDRDEFWIVVNSENGDGILNPRFVTEIIWQGDEKRN